MSNVLCVRRFNMHFISFRSHRPCCWKQCSPGTSRKEM